MSRSTRDPAERAVAIIGVGAILPDAPDAETFWQNVLAGRNSITDVTLDRWSAADYYDADPKAPGKTYSKIGGWVRGIPFDSTQFKIPPRVALAMDEGQKWSLICAGEALRDSGHPDRPLNLESTAVIIGNAMGGERHYQTVLRLSLPEYVHAIHATPSFQMLSSPEREALIREFQDYINRSFPDTTEDTMPGELTNIVAGRIAATYNLRGPNFTTDAACATTFAALQSSIDSLVDHHYDVALTGGMDRNMGATTFIKFCKIGALSPDGSRPYTAGANGFVMGEGGAFFICKRLADAEVAGDRIYAVIRGVGGASDGKGKGITAPNPVGQRLAIQRAWQRAGLDPATMTLLEGHGTSTRVGDLAELESLMAVLSEGTPIHHRIALGSVKSQIGHLKSAAGAAGLLKAVLACHHKILPPSINFNEPHPNIPWDKVPFEVNTQVRPWDKPAFGPRRCGVSSFGFGGTNFHVVVEEYVPGMLTKRPTTVQVPADIPDRSPARVTESRTSLPPMLGNLLAVGGRDAGEVRERLVEAHRKAIAGQIPDRTPPEDAFLASASRMVISFDEAGDLIKKAETALEALDKNDPKKWRVLQTKGIYFRAGSAGKVAFLFPGQGSQYVNMLADVPDPIVRETFAEADQVMAPILGKPLTAYVYKNEADPAAMAAAEEALKDTTICQPAMVATNIAIMRILGKHGIAPDMVMGHSLGEWAAAVSAGMVNFAEALVAVSARARAMASVSIGDKGKMASVLGPTDEIVRRLPEIGGYLTPANINSRKQTVIAGASDAVDRAVDYFNQLGMTAQIIPVSHAFHSKVVAPASDALYRTICEMELKFPRIPLVGNIDGQLYPTQDMDVIRRRLADQMASSVQFVTGVETCYREGARVFVEVGPKRALQALAESILEDKPDAICLSTNHPKRGGVRSFHDAMCGLYAAGVRRTGFALTPAVPELHSVSSVSRDPLPLSSGESIAMSTNRPSNPALAGQPNYEELGRLFARFLEDGRALYEGRQVTPNVATPARRETLVISGAGLGLPGQQHRVFDDGNVNRILSGESCIDQVPMDIRGRMLDKNIVRLHKREMGEPSLEKIRSADEVIRIAGRKGGFDLVSDFGIAAERTSAFDITTALAMGAGIEALRDAGIPLVRHYRRTTTGSYLPDQWKVPAEMADDTGVIFASAFPGFDNVVGEVSRYYEAKLGQGSFEFDRRFIFRALSMGHSQFAEMLGIRGPNIQVNSACASTTGAVGIAEDWIRMGRCRRVIIIGADDLTSDTLLEWMGAGFLATGAASTENVVEKAALPFDRRRHGMLMGMGACGLVVETQEAVAERGMRGIVEILGTEFANSAFHGTRLDVTHIEGVMEKLVSKVERTYGVDRYAMAKELTFISHETYTPARGGSAAAEVFALRKTFGASANDLVVANTKGFTGHPMGVGIEDAIAVKILEKQIVPPVPNFREPDPELGTLNLSRGGRYPVTYALRLAAGFGSQIAMTLLRRIPGVEKRVADEAGYATWLSKVSGYPTASLEVQKRTLRIVDQGQPKNVPQGTSPSPVRNAAPVPGGTPPIAPAPTPTLAPAAVAGNGILERVLTMVSEKTGYPQDMLDPDLDLEADLGVDTVKQAEVFAMVREAFNIPRQENLKLRDYPTLRRVVAYVEENRPDLKGGPVAVPAVTMPSVPVPLPFTVTKPAMDQVADKVLGMVAEKTGYPRDMLDLDLDLEADLGVDTVKQAEVFAMVREAFTIPRQDNLKLRDYPTLRHVIGFVEQNRPDLANGSVAGTVSVAPPASLPAPTSTASGMSVVAEKVLGMVAEKTGYPRDMLELDLDLEADLGVDTVKQAEVFAMVREEFAIPRQDNLKLRDYPTLRHVIGFVETNRPDLVGTLVAPTAVVPVAATVPMATPAVATQASAGVIADKILSVVAEKTGYPQDMLELDLDLEADLGVDTVKQAEVFATVREAFEIPRQDNLKLRDYPTLRHVIGFVEQNRPDLAMGVAVPEVATATVPSQTPNVSAVPVSAAGADPIAAKVLAIVAEKTGYPQDMLELDLDLEADLGVDTVKQAEVFAMVREAFAIPRQDDVKLRDYPTLRHVIGFVQKNLGGTPAPADSVSEKAAPGVEDAAPIAAPVVGNSFEIGVLRRPVLTLRPPLDTCKRTSARLEKGSRVVVVADEGGVGKLLCEELERQDIRILRIDARPERAEIEAALREWTAAGPVQGIFFLAPLDRSPSLASIDIHEFRKLYRDRVLLLHGAVRGLYETLENSGTFLLSATRMGGHHGYAPGGSQDPLGGAVVGFTKALRRERPQALVKAVDFPADMPAETVVRSLLDELEWDPGVVEVGYQGDLRVTVAVNTMTAIPQDVRTPFALGPESVFAVTGGAGAITVAIVRDLAAASRGTFYLLDARQMPPESEHPLLTMVVRDREAAKREVYERLKAEKGRATPAQVEEKLFDLERQAGILEALRSVEEAGGRAFYRQVDVLDANAVKSVVDGIRAESGKLDVILHAAGLERSRSLDRKPVEEFDLVFRVKADGIFNLLASTREMDLKAMVVFSSVAGRFGNAGQADYSSGNDFMCKVASWWAGVNPGVLGIAVDWTAWGGIGMATRGSIPEIMKRAGIDMLDPKEGLPVIRHALLAGYSGEAVVGRRLGILLEPFDLDGGLEPDGTLAARSKDKSLPLPFAKVSFDLHQGLRAEITLDPKAEPFLFDHAIDGIPVLPGVMGLETFAEAAWLLVPHYHVVGLENVRFLQPMKYYRNEARAAIVKARPVLSPDGQVRVHLTLSSMQTIVGREPEEKLHFAGVVVLSPRSPEGMFGLAYSGTGGTIGRDDIYRVFFHGPAYQVLDKVERVNVRHVLGTLAGNLPSDTTDPSHGSLVGPRLIEFCFQTAGVWEIGQTGHLALPSVLEKLTIYQTTAGDTPVFAEVQAEEVEGILSFTARVRDGEGKIYVELSGYRTSRMPNTLPEELAGPFQRIAGS